MADRQTLPGEVDTLKEIEVTPEMIEAGIRELWAYDGGYYVAEWEAVRRI